ECLRSTVPMRLYTCGLRRLTYYAGKNILPVFSRRIPSLAVSNMTDRAFSPSGSSLPAQVSWISDLGGVPMRVKQFSLVLPLVITLCLCAPLSAQQAGRIESM